MKTRYAFLVGIAALAIGVFIGRWGTNDSLNGGEPEKATTKEEASAEATPATPPRPDINRDRMLPEYAAVYIHLDIPELAAQRERFRLIDFVRSEETADVLASFFEEWSPAFINAVTETLDYQGSQLDLALFPKNLDSGEGPPRLFLAGRVENATRDLDSFLRVGLGPFVAGGNVSMSTEEILGLPLLGAAGSKGGLFWTYDEREFLATREKDALGDLLNATARTGESTPEATSEPPMAAWKDDPITFHLDLEKAQKSGILPQAPDPNAPLLFSALALAAGKGFESLHVTGGYEGAVLNVSLKLTHKEGIPATWRGLHLGTDVYGMLPAETLAAVALPLPGPVAPPVPESEETEAGSEVPDATPIQLRMLERMLPEQQDVLRPALTMSSGTIVVGMCPVEAVDGVPGYFLLLPFPGEDFIQGIVDWAKEEGATVESVAFQGLTVHDLDMGDRPILGAAELRRVVMARVGPHLAVATHPDLLTMLDPASNSGRLADMDEYSALRDALPPTAAVRAYFAADFLGMILQGHRDHLNWVKPGAADMSRLLKVATGFSAPVYVSLSADERSLELRINSSSDVASIVFAGIVHRAATAFLIQG